MKRMLALVSTFAVLVTACGALSVGGSGLKVGMVTDIGQLEDKSFNEFSWKGVQEGAKAIGGSAQVIVTFGTVAAVFALLSGAIIWLQLRLRAKESALPVSALIFGGSLYLVFLGYVVWSVLA